MNYYVLRSLSLLVVNASLDRPDGSTLLLSDPILSGTTYRFITQVNSFGGSDVGNYTCTATVRSQLIASYFTGIGQLKSNPIEIVIGKYKRMHPPLPTDLVIILTLLY